MTKIIDKEQWIKCIQRLVDRRATGVQDNEKCAPIVADYARHLRAFDIGDSILDIGCGDMYIKKLVETNHPGVEYVGIDAFPVSNEANRMEIEDDADVNVLYQMCGQFDNVLCFAVLDNLYDLKKAINNIKRLARKSVVILTGIDIEPDEFRTFKISQAELDELMLADGWVKHMSNYLTPKALLVEYHPPADRNIEELFKLPDVTPEQEQELKGEEMEAAVEIKNEEVKAEEKELEITSDAGEIDAEFPKHPEWSTMKNPIPVPPKKDHTSENLTKGIVDEHNNESKTD